MGGRSNSDAHFAAFVEESAWLIERPGTPGRPWYWVASTVVPVGTWTRNPWKATRFATEEDANREIQRGVHPFIPTVVEAKAVSHGFVVEDG